MISARFKLYLSPPPCGEVEIHERSEMNFGWGAVPGRRERPPTRKTPSLRSVFFDLPTRGRAFLALVLFLLSVFSIAPATAAPIKILAIGTSITQGLGVPPGLDFTAVLQARLKA